MPVALRSCHSTVLTERSPSNVVGAITRGIAAAVYLPTTSPLFPSSLIMSRRRKTAYQHDPALSSSLVSLSTSLPPSDASHTAPDAPSVNYGTATRLRWMLELEVSDHTHILPPPTRRSQSHGHSSHRSESSGDSNAHRRKKSRIIFGGWLDGLSGDSGELDDSPSPSHRQLSEPPPNDEREEEKRGEPLILQQADDEQRLRWTVVVSPTTRRLHTTTTRTVPINRSLSVGSVPSSAPLGAPH